MFMYTNSKVHVYTSIKVHVYTNSKIHEYTNSKVYEYTASNVLAIRRNAIKSKENVYLTCSVARVQDWKCMLESNLELKSGISGFWFKLKIKVYFLHSIWYTKITEF